MKTITFSTHKQVILSFTAEVLRVTPDGATLLIEAEGEITHQDPTLAHEVLTGEHECQLQVMEEGEMLLENRYPTTFLVLEPAQLVARLRVE